MTSRERITAAFWKFHEAHPEVYVELVLLARKAKEAGWTKLGMKQLFEVLRWEMMIEGLPDAQEKFKLSNDYTSRYARLIMMYESDLAGIFNTRKLAA